MVEVRGIEPLAFVAIVRLFSAVLHFVLHLTEN